MRATEMLASAGPNFARTLIGPLGSIGTAVVGGTVLKGLQIVPPEHVALRERNGVVVTDRQGVPKEYEPGRRFALWGISVLKPVSRIPRSTDLARFRLDIGQQYDVTASINWNVGPGGQNSYNSLYRATDLTERVTNSCFRGLVATLLSVGEENINNRPAVEDEFKAETREDLEEVGVELIGLIYNAALTDAEKQGQRMKEAMGMLATSLGDRSTSDIEREAALISVAGIAIPANGAH